MLMRSSIAMVILLPIAVPSYCCECEWETDNGLIEADEISYDDGVIYELAGWTSGGSAYTAAQVYDNSSTEPQDAWAHAWASRSKTVEYTCALPDNDDTIFVLNSTFSCIGTAKCTNKKRADQGNSTEYGWANVGAYPFNLGT
jgi:hypothetical protein